MDPTALHYVAVPLVFTVALAYGAGFFAPIKFERQPLQSFWFAYVNHVGPYNTIGSAFAELMKKANALQLQNDMWDSTGKSSNSQPPLAGVYFDNPEITAPESCRASVGLRLKSKLTSQQLASAGLEQREIPAIDNAWVCPWRLASGFMHLPSIIVGVMRVYKKAKSIVFVDSKMESFECLCLELYDGNDMRFCFPFVDKGFFKWTGPSVEKKQQ